MLIHKSHTVILKNVPLLCAVYDKQ